MKLLFGDPRSQVAITRSEETAAIRRNDWHLTGDIGYLDDEAFFICDRKKDMIITGGFNVYSVEVERVMAEFRY